MVANIACFSPGCTNPVIGQCPGYKQSCGRFYCAEHSSSGLCAECAERKRVDEETERIYQDYLKTAQGLFVPGCATQFALAALSMVTFLTFSSFCLETLDSNNLVLTFLLIAICVGPAALIWWYLREKTFVRAKEIAESKPYFDDFFKEYRNRKLRESKQRANQIAGAAALVTLGIAAVASDAQFYSDVHSIRNKLDKL